MIIKNCTVITLGRELRNAAVEIDGTYISAVYPDGAALPQCAECYDAGGNMLMPGFIDLHCHGRSGFDIVDPSPEAVRTIALDKLKEGVSTLIPATLTLPEEQLAGTLQNIVDYTLDTSVKGAKIPGVHLEGPFINCKCIGAQNPDFVRVPDINEVKRLNEIIKVFKVSYAVEVENGVEFTRELINAGIVPSCGHSAASYADFSRAYELGLRNLTHYCNQMTPLHHRDIGLVGSALLKDDVYTEMICDKVHLCPEMIQLLFKLRKTSHILLITDAMRASGLPDGKSSLGGLEVTVCNGEARLSSNGALAGSTLQFNHALRNVYELTGLPLSELVCTTSLNQAESLGLEKLGRIEPGFIADMVVLDKDFNVKDIFINGQKH
jgi:N-acetylglucosamine-6-phosphate deacetylase